MRSDRITTIGEGPRLKLWMTGGLAVADLEGVEALFDEEELNAIGRQLYQLVEEGEVVLINLRGVQRLSSGVIARLVLLDRRLERVQGRLLICGVSPNLRDGVRKCRLDQVLEVFTEGPEAVAADWTQASTFDRCRSLPVE